MNQTAVVFGATGLVGKELVFELFEDPNYLKIIAVVRKPLSIKHSRLEQIIIEDYNQLELYKDKLKADIYFCCIGTTIKIAGTQEAFRKVDVDIPIILAHLANELGVSKLVVISSVGANANSSNFYLKTKGEMENNVKLIFRGNLKFVRPSLLVGHRSEFRFGEKLAIMMMKIFGVFMIGSLKKFRGIKAWDVARAMIKSSDLPNEQTIIESDVLHDLAARDTRKHNPHEVIK